MSENVNIGVFGAGAIGCYLGGCLIDAGHSVVLVGRERIKSEIAQFGLSVSDWKGRNAQIMASQVNFSLQPDALSTCDVIIITVKSGDTTEAAREVAQHVKPGALVISFQNGLRNGELLKEQLPEMTVLTGMVPFNVINDGKGHFHCGTEGNLALEHGHGTEKRLVKALGKAALPVYLYPEMKTIQWGKLLMNLNNSINALSGMPLLEQLQQRDYRRVLAATIKEALKVLKAAGIKPARTGKVIPALLPFILSLPNGLFKRVANAMLKIDPKAVSSMSQDLELGRKTEIDFLNGEVVNLAVSVGMKAPVNQLILEIIKKAESIGEGSPAMSPEVLWHAVNSHVR